MKSGLETELINWS